MPAAEFIRPSFPSTWPFFHVGSRRSSRSSSDGGQTAVEVGEARPKFGQSRPTLVDRGPKLIEDATRRSSLRSRAASAPKFCYVRVCWRSTKGPHIADPKSRRGTRWDHPGQKARGGHERWQEVARDRVAWGVAEEGVVVRATSRQTRPKPPPSRFMTRPTPD